jgi:hypothetical protein
VYLGDRKRLGPIPSIMQRQLISPQLKSYIQKNRFPVLIIVLLTILSVIAFIGALLTTPSSPFYLGGATQTSSTTSSSNLPPAGTDVGPHADTLLLAELIKILPYDGLNYRIEYVDGGIVLYYRADVSYSKQGGLTFLKQYDIFNQSIPFSEVPY